MKFKTLTGKLKDVSISDTKIDWEGDSLSIFQETVKDFFYPFWKNDIVCEEFRIPATRMSIDILNVTKRMAVEVQGAQHSQYNEFMSGSRAGYLSQLKRDESKRKWCDINQLILIEIHPKDLPLTKDFIESTWEITL